MNVLAKIVIPKTNVTMQYINNELEELAREEFFRLKKVLEIKRKMYGGKEEKKKKKEDSDLCPGCLEDIKKGQVNTITEEEQALKEIAEICESPCLSTAIVDGMLANQELEELLKQLNNVIDVTTDMEGKGLLQASTDDFLKTAKDLMSKLGQVVKDNNAEDEAEVEDEDVGRDESVQSDEAVPLNVDIGKFCEQCREKYGKNYEKEIQTDTEKSDSKEDDLNETEIEENLDSSTPSSSDVELDTCETEFKEITKITKTVNEDGSVTLQKKVIKIEKEIRTPVRSKASSSRTSANKSNITGQSSNSSSHSKPYSKSKTIGQVSLKHSISRPNLLPFYGIQRTAKSEILGTISPMCNPGARFCMSSVTLLSADVDFDYKTNNDRNVIIFNNGNTIQQ